MLFVSWHVVVDFYSANFFCAKAIIYVTCATSCFCSVFKRHKKHYIWVEKYVINHFKQERGKDKIRKKENFAQR